MLPMKKKAAVSESDVVMYLAAGLKHLRLMGLLVAFSLLLGLDYYIFARSIYFSKTLIRAQSIARPMDTGSLFHDSSPGLVFGVMKGPQVTARVAKRLGYPASVTALYKKHLKSIRILRDSEKNVIVEVYAYSFALARDWPQVMLEEYLAYRDERRIEAAESAIKIYTSDLAQMRERINLNLDQRFAFKQTNEMDKLIMDLNEIRDLPKAIMLTKRRLSAMDHIRESINTPGRDIASKLALIDSLETDPTTQPANSLRDNQLQINVGQMAPALETQPSDENSPPREIVVLPSMVAQTRDKKGWEALEKDRTRIQQEITAKSRTFLSGHPQIVALKQQLAATTHALELEFAVALNKFDVEYTILTEKKQQFEKKLPDYEDISRRHEKMTKEYAQLQAPQTAWTRFYNLMNRRLDAMDFGFDKERNDFEYVGPVDLKDKPIAPTRSRLLLYSLILGLSLAICIPFLIEYLNTRVSDIEHAEETLRIRGLGVVPKILEVPFETLLVSDQDDKTDYHLRENFRLIRTNLIVNSENAALPQVILVTSAMPQEGKTCVAANLAISFASKGEKTLLMDADLRRGRAYKLFNCVNKPGLSNVLAGEATFEQACRFNGHENLTVMTCGKHLNGASELLDSQRFTDLMADLRGKYQRIIVDTPPVLGLSETIILQRYADGVMLVIWSDFTPMSTVKAAVQTLQINGAKFAGFVLNRLDFTKLDNRYKYFYYAPLYYANYQPLPAPVADSTKA